MGEEWTDAEIRGFIERVAMERRRAERKALARRKQPRRLVPKRAGPKDVRRPASLVAKKKRLAG
ncbi:MAG: hypothetical protein ACE5IQ_08670 [Candidatus Methylomirabilales bacterium]